MRIIVESEAAADLRQAKKYYREHAPHKLDDFRANVKRALALIRQRPFRGSPHAAGTRRVLLHDFPYSIVYAVEGHISIVSIVHHRRDPEFWHDRVGGVT